MTLHVVIPYWGEPRYLIDAIDSVRAQHNPDWLLTIVDDGYPGTAAADHIAALADPRIDYLRNEERLGPNGNTYKASRLVRAEYLCMMGADDLLEPDYVDIVATHLDADDAVVAVQPGVTVIDEAGAVRGGLADRIKAAISPGARSPTTLDGEHAARSLLAGNWLYTPSLTYRSSAVEKVPFHPGIDAIHDLAFVMDLLLDGGRLAVDPRLAFRYRRHRSSDSAVRARDGIRFEEEQRYFGEVATQLRTRSWTRAARAAELHVFSRLHATKVALELLAARDVRRSGRMLRFAVRRVGTRS